MKTTKIFLGIVAFAAITVCSCNKEMELVEPDSQPTVSEAIPFTITLSSSNMTKTKEDDSNPYITKFNGGDAIRLFHAEAGTTAYVNDGMFTCATGGADNVEFSGTLASGLDPAKNYDWYAVYPYTDAQNECTPENVIFDILPTIYSYATPGLGDLPLYGKCENVSGSLSPDDNSVRIVMKQMLSAFKLTITNETGKDFSAASIRLFFKGGDPNYSNKSHTIRGKYIVNITGIPSFSEVNGENYVDFSFSSRGTNTIANEGSFTCYLPFVPYDYKNFDKLIHYISFGIGENNGSGQADQQYPYEKKFVYDKIFEPGMVYPVNYTVTNEIAAGYISGSEALSPVCFGFCHDDKDLQDEWSGSSNGRFFSNLDIAKSRVDNVDIGRACRAWLDVTLNKPNADAVQYSNTYTRDETKTRFFLATSSTKSLKNPVYFNAHVKYAEIPSGKSDLVFRTSLSLGNKTSGDTSYVNPQQFKIFIYQDGNEVKPSEVKINSGIGSWDSDKEILKIDYEKRKEDGACYPIEIRYTPSGIGTNGSEFIVSIENSKKYAEDKTIVGGQFGFAPYYEYDGTQRVYGSTSTSRRKTSYDYIFGDCGEDLSASNILKHRSAYFVWE